eukprot:1195361-Prorocentrum_minimum.AAC.11
MQGASDGAFGLLVIRAFKEHSGPDTFCYGILCQSGDSVVRMLCETLFSACNVAAIFLPAVPIKWEQAS